MSMGPKSKKSSKPLFKTDVPFTKATWPTISQEHQDVCLDLLCNLLQPIGDHRRTHVPPSKGSKKRKRAQEPTPPYPEIDSHKLVGISSVTRHLTSLALRTAPAKLKALQPHQDHEAKPVQDRGHRNEEEKDTASNSQPPETPRPLTIIFLTHASPSTSIQYAHLPTLVYLTSVNPNARATSLTSPYDSSTRSDPTTRVVTLASNAETRLAHALRIPRVGVVGVVEGAPGADVLVEYVREHVGLVDCPMIEEGLKAEWKGVQTTVQMT